MIPNNFHTIRGLRILVSIELTTSFDYVARSVVVLSVAYSRFPRPPRLGAATNFLRFRGMAENWRNKEKLIFISGAAKTWSKVKVRPSSRPKEGFDCLFRWGSGRGPRGDTGGEGRPDVDELGSVPVPDIIQSVFASQGCI